MARVYYRNQVDDYCKSKLRDDPTTTATAATRIMRLPHLSHFLGLIKRPLLHH